MNVDSPEPDGPMTATNFSRFDAHRHAAEGRDSARAEFVVLGEILRFDERERHLRGLPRVRKTRRSLDGVDGPC
jgi:hypothetical protein